MQITLNDKTYVMTVVKSRMVRKSMEISEKFNFDKLKAKDLDVIATFICELYGNKFNIDDIYDNLPANELMPFIVNSIQSITGTMNEKLDQFPK
jgi:hypothetical protein